MKQWTFCMDIYFEIFRNNHKYDLRVFLGKSLIFFSFIYQSQTNQITLKTFFQDMRFILGSWNLTRFVKLSLITGAKIKYIFIKFLFFTSIHTANVLEKNGTWVFYSGMLSINLGVWFSPVHQESPLGPEVNIVLNFESRFGPGQTGRELSLSFLPPSHLFFPQTSLPINAGHSQSLSPPPTPAAKWSVLSVHSFLWTSLICNRSCGSR